VSDTQPQPNLQRRKTRLAIKSKSTSALVVRDILVPPTKNKFQSISNLNPIGDTLLVFGGSK
jgi:hypothetical protein